MPTEVGEHQESLYTTPGTNASLASSVMRDNFNAGRTAYNAHDNDTGIHVQSSTLAARPAAGTAGRKWITLNTDGSYHLWFDNGAAWVEVTGLSFAVVNGQPGVFDAGNSGAAIEVDWNDGPVQKITLTDNATVTFVNPSAGSTYTLILVQDIVGARTVALTGWEFGDNAPSYNTTALKKNVVSGLYDGTEYLAAFAVQGG